MPPAAQQVAAPAAPADCRRSPPDPRPSRSWHVAGAARAQARRRRRPSRPPSRWRCSAQSRRSLWWIALPLLLLVAAGGTAPAWYLKIRSSEHRLPALAGMTETEARALLKPPRVHPRGHPGGQASRSPPARSSVPTRQRASPCARATPSRRSSAPARRRAAFPSLIGMTIAAATDELAADGLVPQRDADVFDEQVAAGSVVSFSVDGQPAAKAGDDVARGSVIRLVVSKGPKPRKAPQLRGLSTADATTVLDQLDLVLDVSSRPSAPTSSRARSSAREPAANADVA